MGRSTFLIKWHRLHKPLKLLILVYVVFSSTIGAAAASDSDASALLELKSKIYDPFGGLSSWNSGKNPDHCSWTGVHCDSASRVVALNITGGGSCVSCARISQFPLYGFGMRRACLGENGRVVLSGEISAAVAGLSELRILSLPFNELSGEIPAAIWKMEKLEVLDLEGNLLSGSLPSQFSGLRNLQVLNLGFNEISGGIPHSLTNSPGLQLLNLAGNQLNGSIPSFIAYFKDLNGLYLSFNLLSGPIPDQIGSSCEKLQYLELSGNYLSDNIPSSLGNCTALKTLLLYSNMLDLIPPELGKLTQLQLLDVSRNNLGGSIPPTLGYCTNLSVLVLSNLWDPLPDVSILEADFSQIKLAYTADEYNYYEGIIPPEITNLSSLRMLWAPRAIVEADFPFSWGSCDSLEMLNFAQNFYSGKLPESFGSCNRIQFLDLSSNRLSGAISHKLSVPCMTLFDVSWNSFSGSIPKFDSISCDPVVSVNWDSYDPASVYIRFFENQAQVKSSFGFNRVEESLLVVHNFGFNVLTGPAETLPVASDILRGNKTIYAFLASGNKLSGEFPGALFEKCGEARGMIVNVSDNQLSGEFPLDVASRCRSLILLDASGNHVSGDIPVSFGDLASLAVLNLNWNYLQGSIPSSFGGIKDMKRLSLSGNKLNGSIPSSLGQLYSLEVLELSSNSLSGEIPKGLANLKNLSVLLVNNNKLSGQLPLDLATIFPTLSTFNGSFNNFSGLLSLNNSMIQCNDSFMGNPLLKCTASSTSPDQSGDQQYSPSAAAPLQKQGGGGGGNSSSLTPVEITCVVAASAIVLVLICVVIIFIYTRKWKPRSRVSGTARKEVFTFTDIGYPLTFENVVRATASFNASNCIGSGGFGATYKAELAPGVMVAIKRLAVGRFQGVQQFDAEIRTLGRLRHPNLVTLIGYHASETEMFLIYNYLPGGNLEKFIQDRSTRAVDWRVLHKIALDIARALAYLHDQCIPRVLHRDVKPSNILLDEDYNAYLSDFGLARLLGTSETHATTGVAGTFGYVAPEYAMTCRVSDKADVYSYGVVLLELISDKKALDPSFSSYGNGFNIVGWACMLLRQGKAKELFTAGLWDAGPHDDLVDVLHLAVVCTVESLSTRPTMKQVVKRLKQLQPPSR
ncbi:hypothetical protein M569_04565 [Genlisea aurea]|uniref:non-specific serine/threonine protein kinase n=1 Tax=Genlisea aurea TaxID=192259 RepID=S8E3A4_9LAMI|nr:hypothetical protein M569_04565 [Genlisea aurea]